MPMLIEMAEAPRPMPLRPPVAKHGERRCPCGLPVPENAGSGRKRKYCGPKCHSKYSRTGWVRANRDHLRRYDRAWKRTRRQAQAQLIADLKAKLAALEAAKQMEAR